ncbi:MAG: sugar ABC transporter substrate-binding protein [Thermoguttaceae bacterium]|jgi:ribose transport system substrate-binding protein|nr:sugar ABC transporter substrate-binding protein [Thermoguttaceae bacterium]
MTTRLYLATFAALVFAFATFAGCSWQVVVDSEQGAATKPRIALVMKSLANEFFSTMAEGAREHQKANAAQYELIVNGIKDERDLARQVSLVEDMIAQGVQAIVIAPADSKALVPVLKRALDQGIVVVNIDNKLDDEVLAKTGARIPFIGPDNRAGARKVGEAVAARLEPGDRVLVLEGIRTSLNGQQRRLGFEDAAKAAGLVIADSQSAQWEMNQANQVASAMLSSHPEAKAILAANDNMALGALAAVRSAGKGGSVLIAGFDNIGAVQQAIRSGDILATADQYGDRLAVYGIEYALQILAGQAEPADRETPVDLVTAESLSQP